MPQPIALHDDAEVPEDGWRGRLIRRSGLLALIGIVCASLLAAHARIGHSRSELHVSLDTSNVQSLCPQAEVLTPAANATLDNRRHDFLMPAYRARAIGVLSRIVETRAESFDGEGLVGEDPRWTAFDGLHERLRTEFPAIHARDSPIELQKINTYGCVAALCSSSHHIVGPNALTCSQPALYLARQQCCSQADPAHGTSGPRAFLDSTLTD